MEVPSELAEKVYKLIESVKVDGKLKKGANEVTKCLEKDEAKMVISASDINPKEIIMHFSQLSEEKKVPYVVVPSKAELGAAAGLPVSTSAVAIVKFGESKKQYDLIVKALDVLKKGGKVDESEAAEESSN